CGNT
ncbi:Protein of unknown function, partial [Gryllus bimaculatus]